MTKQEVLDEIRELLTPPVTDIEKVNEAYQLVMDFITESSTDNLIPDWTALLTFNTDGSDDGLYCKHPDTNGKKRIFESLEDDNQGNEPPTDPDISSNAFWNEISQAGGSAIKEWTPGMYGTGVIIVYHDHSNEALGRQLYLLTEPERPFHSTNLETELNAGKWSYLYKEYVDHLRHTDIWKYIATVYADSNIVLSGLQTIDGVILTAGMYVLAGAQTDGKENGWWRVVDGDWERATFASTSVMLEGAVGMIARGTVHKGKIFKMTTSPFTLGVDDLVFEDHLSPAYAYTDALHMFKGYYASLVALQTAHPTAEPGNYAVVDAGVGTDAQKYIWDDDDEDWVISGGAPAVNASETQEGVVEEATVAEIIAGTSTGSTGAKLFVSAAKLLTFLVNSFFGIFSAKTTPVDADHVMIGDSADSNRTKKTTWANIKATLKTYFDTLYQPSLTAVSISGGTLTLDASVGDNFDLTTTVSTNFNLAISNHTGMIAKRLFLRVTGTVVISMTTTSVTHVMGEFEKLNSRWSDTGDTLTIVGGTDSPFTIVIEKDGAGTPNFKYYCSDKQL